MKRLAVGAHREDVFKPALAAAAVWSLLALGTIPGAQALPSVGGAVQPVIDATNLPPLLTTADDHLDALYLKIFNELLSLMMEDARSIRRATSLMFVAKHLERFGDHAVSIARRMVFLVTGEFIEDSSAVH